MTSTLRQVLTTFEEAQTPLTLGALSRRLGVPPGILDGMIDHWVRKGRLREVTSTAGRGACSSCGAASGCPLIINLPRSFVLARDDDPIPASDPPPCQ